MNVTQVFSSTPYLVSFWASYVANKWSSGRCCWGKATGIKARHLPGIPTISPFSQRYLSFPLFADGYPAPLWLSIPQLFQTKMGNIQCHSTPHLTHVLYQPCQSVDWLNFKRCLPLEDSAAFVMKVKLLNANESVSLLSYMQCIRFSSPSSSQTEATYCRQSLSNHLRESVKDVYRHLQFDPSSCIELCLPYWTTTISFFEKLRMQGQEIAARSHL